jgi:MerR family transcriptional regulator, light-induced transcriptional regulator
VSNYSIKDLEQLSGIKAHTIRVWEQRHNILKPKRTETNIRTYDNDDLKMVLNIAILNEHGHKISRIAKMESVEVIEEVQKLTQEYCHYPDQIQALTLAMVDIDEARFERIMTTNILRIGLEKTMTEIIYPFLTRIGILWLTGAINPAQEHFITNLIRQKLIVAIDGQTLVHTLNTKQFILFLPDGELHELGLLFACFLIKKRNHRVIYLGQSLPVEDLLAVCRVSLPDYLFGIFTGSSGKEQYVRYLEKLTGAYSATPLLITGSFVGDLPKQLQEKINWMKSVRDLSIFLDELNESDHIAASVLQYA